MSVSSGLKRPHQKWMARDTCRSSSQSCRCTLYSVRACVPTKYDTLPLPPTSRVWKTLCAERNASSSTMGDNHEPSYTRGRCMWGPVSQLKRQKPNHSTFSTMPAWRRAKTTESQNASKNTTDGHALCNVRGNDNSLANGSGSSLSFVLLGELFQTAARKSHDVLTERRHVCNELVDHA